MVARALRLTAVRADGSQAFHLHPREDDPLLRSTSVNVDLDERPVEYGRTGLRATGSP
ncbi:MAG: UTRA domain-containing protein [Pseudomonadota bacterium]